jgi:superfamily II DNA or RNA helicase
LNDADVFPPDRLLYNHQSEALRTAASFDQGHRPALVITAGTGLGKTEAFLLPMLADLWSGPERKRDGGMRCLILYPMNALIADQVDRIYRWLQGQERLTVFHFTSDTPENKGRANKRGVPDWEPCRMRTRQEARGFESHRGETIDGEPFGRVPDIVITNYSMLEYMLCRPQDSRFFGPDLRCIILDEAHLYSGALAAEITMLLRRLRERCHVSPQDALQIATSATLGGSDEDLRGFASSLFSTDKANTKVIRGRYADHDFGDSQSAPGNAATAKDLAPFSNLNFATLNSDDALIEDGRETVEELQNIVTMLVSSQAVHQALKEHPNTPARFLHAALREAPFIRKAADMLAQEKGSVLNLDDLAGRLFDAQSGDSERQATIALLRLAASARMRASDFPLLPHRLHFLVRAPEGLSVCLNPNCSGPDERRVPCIGCLQPYGDNCGYCEHIMLPVHRCDNCGDWALAAHENQQSCILEPGYYAESAAQRTYYLLARPRDCDLEEVSLNTENGEVRGHGAGSLSLWKAPRVSTDDTRQKCPTCHSLWSIAAEDDQQPEWRRTCRSLVGGRPFAMSLTAETVLHDLPAFPGVSRNWKPAEGRRLLAFSDSRASAARLGPRLTQQHEIQVLRAAMVRCARNLTPESTVSYLEEEVDRLESSLSRTDLTAEVKQRVKRDLQQKQVDLLSARAGTSFSDFAALVANRAEMAQLLDRETADNHRAETYGQRDWDRNSEAIKNHAEGLIGTELQRPLKTQSSVESVGLLQVVYPGIDRLALPPLLEEKLQAEARVRLKDVWPQMVTLLLDTVRADGCVEWSNLNDNRKWLGESPLRGRWLTQTRGGWGARAFVGATIQQLRLKFVSNVLAQIGCSEANAYEISTDVLSHAFNCLFSLATQPNSGFDWLKSKNNHQTGPEEADRAIQILLDRLTVCVPAQLFRCDSTGTIWTSSALGWAPIAGCLGTLKPVSVDELDIDPRWSRPRREFLESPILSIGLWAEEHSAQLSPEENRRLQDLFKGGIRNVLSSTTTMELGIDIGGLNAVLLGNVPPGPANHRQRAGRAGRRSDGSAVVVTYSRDSDYDRDVFRRFGAFLQRELRKPTVFLDRARIIRRHLHAILLSDFLRSRQPSRTGAMHAFGKMGSFCGINAIPLRWSRSAEPKPLWPPEGVNISKQFLQFLELIQAGNDDLQSRFAFLTEHSTLNTIGNADKWSEFIGVATELFSKAIEEWRNEVGQLRTAWDEIASRPTANVGREMAKANSIRYMIKTLCEITVIEWLADRRFLPRYGFPINLQRLSIRKAVDDGARDRSEPDERYRLERSSLLALSEYVPESRVLVGGRVATSRGLRKHWTDHNLDEALGLQSFALECAVGHVYIRQAPDDMCPRCGSSPARKQSLVFPRFGYTTAGWESLPLGRDIERIGEQSVCPTAFAEHGVGEVIDGFAAVPQSRLTYPEEAPLLVRNSGRRRCGFAICTRCGFAMSEDEYGEGRMNLPREFETHASVFSSNPRSFCWEKGEQAAPILRNRVLAARELTDMLLLEWPGGNILSQDAVYSFGRALLLAGARLLELDERELGMVLMPLHDPNLGIAIYDTAPGGAGHCQELITLGQHWIEFARRILYVDERHHARCKKACLDCILDFSGQYSAGRLDRLAAIELVDDALLRR